MFLPHELMGLGFHCHPKIDIKYTSFQLRLAAVAHDNNHRLRIKYNAAKNSLAIKKDFDGAPEKTSLIPVRKDLKVKCWKGETLVFPYVENQDEENFGDEISISRIRSVPVPFINRVLTRAKFAKKRDEVSGEKIRELYYLNCPEDVKTGRFGDYDDVGMWRAPKGFELRTDESGLHPCKTRDLPWNFLKKVRSYELPPLASRILEHVKENKYNLKFATHIFGLDRVEWNKVETLLSPTLLLPWLPDIRQEYGPTNQQLGSYWPGITIDDQLDNTSDSSDFPSGREHVISPQRLEPDSFRGVVRERVVPESREESLRIRLMSSFIQEGDTTGVEHLHTLFDAWEA